MVDLGKLQKEVIANKLEKGFNTTDLYAEFAFAHGELSEAFDAWRKNPETVGEELADVIIYLLGIAEILNIDLERELLEKMEKNRIRVYVTNERWIHIKSPDSE